MKDVTKLQIDSLKVQQMAQPSGKRLDRRDSSSQDRHRLKYRHSVNHLRFMLIT